MFFSRVADPKIEGLRQVPVFSELSNKELELVASRMDEVRVPAGQRLTWQGSPGHSFYVLLEGEVTVEIDGTEVANRHAGEFFGEISMLDRGLATATVTTRTPATMLVMSHGQFQDAIRGNDALLAGVMAAMAVRLRMNEEAGFTRPR